MMQLPRRRWIVVASVFWATVFSIPTASACSVCFGDPESAMAKGAAAGVVVLIGVVGCVLLGILGTGLMWVHRGRRLARLERSSDSAPHAAVDDRS